MTVSDLGCKTNIEVIQQLISLDGKRVIDAGCGGMALTKQLAEQGASVLAIDPDSVQAELNRNVASVSNVEFVETGADRLPAENASMDGVFFAYSLHHVPSELYPAVFQEVFRVLKPGGFLHVIEPIDCPLNEVMKFFHDETDVRSAAQVALQTHAVPAFDSYVELTYHSWRQFDSWEDFASQFASRTFNTSYTESDIRRDEVRLAFERLGAPDYRFQAPKQIMSLSGLKK